MNSRQAKRRKSGRFVLDCISFSVKKGRRPGLGGPSQSPGRSLDHYGERGESVGHGTLVRFMECYRRRVVSRTIEKAYS